MNLTMSAMGDPGSSGARCRHRCPTVFFSPCHPTDHSGCDGLERLCRYVNRPPLAYGRLRQLDRGDLAFALKTPWEDGTTHRVFAPYVYPCVVQVPLNRAW